MKSIRVFLVIALAGCAVQDGKIVSADPYGEMNQDAVSATALVTASLFAVGFLAWIFSGVE
jgi:hypothetical protein